MSRYFIYVRKSSESEDRQVLSINSQKAELDKIVKQEKLCIIDTLEESASAKAPGRPVFSKMMKKIERGEADSILTWHPNRLSRNSVDTGQIVYLFDQGKLQEVRSPGQVFRNTPSDKFLLNLLCSQAKLENDNKILDVKRGMRTKAEMGWYPTIAPIGYLNTPKVEKGKRYIKKDPRRFDLIRKMFDLILSGVCTPPKAFEIATKEWGLRNRGGKSYVRSALYRVINDPFYYGWFEYPKGSGNWYQGKHQPMISKEEYERIQCILGRNGNTRGKAHVFAYTGLIRCGECGAMVTAEEKTKRQKNGNLHHYVYYHCTKRKNAVCHQQYLNLKSLESQIADFLRTIYIPLDLQEWAIDQTQRQDSLDAQNIDAIKENQRKALETCVRKIDRLIDMRANEEISADEYLSRRNELMKEKIHLQETIEGFNSRLERQNKGIKKLYSFAQNVLPAFKNGDMKTRRAILSSIGSNLTLKDRKIDIILEKELEPLKSISLVVNAIFRRFEPQGNRMDKDVLRDLFTGNPLLCPGMDDVRTYSVTSEKYDRLPDLEETEIERKGDAD